MRLFLLTYLVLGVVFAFGFLCDAHEGRPLGLLPG
jgi:hypothetical protein